MSSGEPRGLVLVNTGPGKGKTTAALGQALRASGAGLAVLIVQFIKNRDTGERTAIGRLPGVEIVQVGAGMVSKAGATQEDRAKAREALAACRLAADSGRYGLIVLDEICVALKYGLLETGEVLDFIRSRPADLHLVLTGRDCPGEILDAADTVTRMEEVKHHYRAGIKAVKGIEF